MQADRSYSELEKELLDILRGMVLQHCQGRDGYYETGFLSANEPAILTLVEHGIMVDAFSGTGQGVYFKFVDLK